MADDNLLLRAGALELGISPSVGGTISWFDEIAGERRTPILRGCHTPLENALGAASFPLVPYVNRIRGGRFTFRGRDIVLQPNMAGDPSPLHGDGWLGAWQVEHKGAREVTLRFHHQPGEWPWEYEARQVFALDPRGLTVTLDCRNLSGEPMPCGLGQHPYFPCGAATRIDTHVTYAWTIDDAVLPVDKVAATGRFDLAGRPVCAQGLDHGFGGWSGSAVLTDPAWPFALELSSPTARFFQLYSPADGGLFVAEPVTHANAALNAPEAEWAELGMAVLGPGNATSLAMRLEVTPK